MTVKKETKGVRQFVVCAVLRDVKFDATNYASFIELQDKLHQNICRYARAVAYLNALHSRNDMNASLPQQAHACSYWHA